MADPAASMSPCVLETERLLLTIGAPVLAGRYLAYVVDNEPHLAPWEPPRPEGYFTLAHWYRRLEQSHDERAKDLSLRLAIWRRGDPDGPILGHVNFTQFIRGNFHSCFLGYSLDRRVVGKGLMTEALGAAIPYVFGHLKLHRIQANYVPTNDRSGQVLRRMGFVVEGYARDYLFIGGAWRDHVLTSRTSTDSSPPRL